MDHGFIGSFLGTIDGTGSPGAAEGVINIAGNPEGTFRKLRQDVLGGDGCDLCQTLGSRRDLFSVSVQDPVSQGLEHSYTSVVGGAAADAHDKSAAAFLDGGPDHLTDPKGGGFHGILFCIRYQGDPGGSGHFQDRCAAFRKDPVLALHRNSQRSGDGDSLQFSAHAAGQGLHGPFPSVGQGADVYRGAFVYTPDPFFDGTSGLQGREAALQRIDGNGDVHEKPPYDRCFSITKLVRRTPRRSTCCSFMTR